MNGKTYLTWVATLTAAFVLSISSPAAEKESSANKSTSTSTSSSSASKSKKVNLNTASKSELQSLPGVGPSIADGIIAARPFKSVNDLKNVSGIGDQRFQEIHSLVTVSSSTGHASGSGKPGAEAKSKSNVPPGSTTAAKKDNASGSSGSASTGHASGSGKPGADAKSKSSVPPGSKSEAATKGASTGGKVNLNTASLAELEALPGIGPVKGQAIIDARPFKTTEDVMKVNGIKEGIYEQIRDQITVR